MRTVLILLALGMALVVRGQSRHFTLTSCPASSGVVKADFDSRYGALASEAEYVQVLRRTFTGEKGGRYVHYTEHQPGGGARDLVFHIPSARSHPAGLVSLASKGSSFSTVESKAELRELLKDTVALRGTLWIRARLLDADLSHDGWFLLWTDPRDGKPYKSMVPARADTLLFHAAFLGDAPLREVAVRLRHEALKKQDLATFTFRLIGEEEWDALNAEVCAVCTGEPALDALKCGQLLHQYCTAEFGSLPVDQLPPPACMSKP